MAEQHPAEDQLLELALGHVSESEAPDIVQHLSTCVSCQREFQALTETIDQTLAAAPRFEPPPGFDRTVLAALGFSENGSGRKATRLRQTLYLAAACVLGILLGIGGLLVFSDGDDSAAPPSTEAALPRTPLLTESGEPVGSVALSYFDGDYVIVVSAAGGREGVVYECRLRLASGETVVVGEWPVPENGATWVMPAPRQPADRVELVDDAGEVWSAADL